MFMIMEHRAVPKVCIMYMGSGRIYLIKEHPYLSNVCLKTFRFLHTSNIHFLYNKRGRKG